MGSVGVWWESWGESRVMSGGEEVGDAAGKRS